MEYINNESSFLQAISVSGLGTPNIIPDGKIHRFRGDDDKLGSLNCWYIFFGLGGSFGSWKLGFTEKWFSKACTTRTDRKRLAKHIQQAQLAQKKERISQQAEAGDRVRQLYNRSGEAQVAHPYLLTKAINPHRIHQQGNRLWIPMYDGSQLCNIQQIWPDGKKRFMKGGKVTGCYFPLGNMVTSRTLLICEGFATGCSLHEATGLPIAVAFNAGNLKAVATLMRKRFSNIKITIAADNDTATPGNPGLTKARQAAAAINGEIIYPDFSGLAGTGSDFNDYLLLGGKI